MKIWKLFITVVCLLMFIVGYQKADAQENLAQQVSAIFQQNCSNCHGPSGSHKEALLIDRTALVDTEVVIPGAPENSEFYKRLLGPTENGPQMPLNLPPLSPETVETIAHWITAGAPDWNVQHDINFITTDTILDTIRTHLKSLDPFDRPSARYFTMTHLYNAGETSETLSDYRIALSKLINSLSWRFEITNPTPIDEAQTIFYIDLRRYEWNTTTEVWPQIEQAYPYNIAFDPETQTGLLEKLTQLQTETGSTVPFVHVDWFLATASLPPLYHDILDLPQTDRILEAKLEVNIASNIRNAPGIDVWRAGFNDSGVSSNNRVVERHTSRYGAYWKSYDFAGSAGSQNIFTHPLDFTHDGGEIIFNLPNGLQAYLLVDTNGNRLDDAPINIVSNPAASDPTVKNGLSCIGCHTQGMKKFKDSVRAAIEQDGNPPYNKAQALRLYPEQSVLDALVEKDTLRFQEALEKIGGPFADDASRERFFKKCENEPVQRFHELFQAPLDALHAAAAVGLETAEFLTHIREKQSLKNLGLQTLVDVNGTVKRDAWTSNFDDVISALNTPDNTLLPVVQRPGFIPGESVDIPDPNLRAAIKEALGKASGDLITAVDMAKLTNLHAIERDIHDLTGLESATNLEILKLNKNFISDLSPLAGLKNLKEAWLTGGPADDGVPGMITDLSPLAGLTNLEGLALWKLSIYDISALQGLTKLRWLELGHNDGKVSDISPLANLTGLKRLLLYGMGNFSDISPLANLTGLRNLSLHGHAISDVGPLAALSELEVLGVSNNDISNFSPLEELSRKIPIISSHNPGFPKGPKIEGPWLWMIVPTNGMNPEDAAASDIDFLAEASDNGVTELNVAANGATVGTPIGNNVWTLHKISSTPAIGNINEVVNATGLERDDNNWHVVYGSILLNSPEDQQVNLLVGTANGSKVWLNGTLVYDNPFGGGVTDYISFVPVTLKAGINVLLTSIYERSNDVDGSGRWTGLFGFETGTAYTVVNEGINYAFSEPNIHLGDTFTLDIRAENMVDLAGWQFDIVFDPEMLEAVEINEGGFLKTDGESTFFQQGTIDNTSGKIIGLNATRFNEDGATGTGTLLSVTFLAKTEGETRLTLDNLQFGSVTGKIIPIEPAEVIITIARKLTVGDVNRDGQVSILDMILVAQYFGEDASTSPQADVNRDGTINIQDLLLVAQHLGESTAATAPAVIAINNGELTREMIQAWIAEAQIESDGSIVFQQGIANLERLLTLFIPEKTILLANYPNPFNPETWIPYHLANPSDVTITIYNMNGTVVRQLDLGHQREGYYTSKPRAAYWDGRNAVGERVASGIYFYQLQADGSSPLRKMVILK